MDLVFLKRMKNSLNKLLFYLLVFLVPIGTKKFITSFPEPFKIPISYGSFFLYGLDIIVLLFVVLNLRKISLDRRAWWLLSFLAAALVSVFFSLSFGLAVYAFFHLALFALFALIIARMMSDGFLNLKNTFLVLGCSAVAEAVVGLLQFRDQASVGLRILGESVLGPMTEGVARASTAFGDFLRIYGTMPHANILAGFLVFGFVALLFVFSRTGDEKRDALKRLGIVAALFLILSAILLTFSRSGLAVFVFAVGTTIVYGLSEAFLRRRSLFLIGVLLLFVVFSAFGFKGLATARDSVSLTEPSVTYRVDYGLIAFDLIRSHPIFGVGVGNEVLAGLTAGLYQGQGMHSSWQWQPAHNLYLLIASETGLVGLALFVGFLWSVFWPAAKEFWKERKSEQGLDLFFPLVLGVSWLAFGMVDHFFWDLESGQLMFWLTLGIIMGVSAHSSTDRAYPSEG